MEAREKALLTYRALEKRKQKKKDEEKKRLMDTNSSGWDGYTKFRAYLTASSMMKDLKDCAV